MLWLIAAESDDGTIPSAKAIAWRLRLSEREVSFDIQSLTHYIEPLYIDSRAILASDRDREETETEREIERERSREPLPKLKFMDYVLLTESEHADIVRKLNGHAEAYIERLNGYLGQTGRRYKSHYHTILNWYRKDVDSGKVSRSVGEPF